MAEGKITITILGGGGDGSGGGGGDKKKEKSAADIMQDTLKKVLHPLKTAKEGVEDLISDALGGDARAITAVYLGGKVIGEAISTVYQIAMMEHNRYFTLTEDYMGQNKMNAFNAQLSTATSIISSTSAGAIAGGEIGKVAGPVGWAVGTAVGAIVGGATSITKAKINRDQKIEQQNMQLNAINAQTEFMASRASLVNGGRGTEY